MAFFSCSESNQNIIVSIDEASSDYVHRSINCQLLPNLMTWDTWMNCEMKWITLFFGPLLNLFIIIYFKQ